VENLKIFGQGPGEIVFFRSILTQINEASPSPLKKGLFLKKVKLGAFKSR